MSDELLLPQVPEAKADDTEDVSWALSTAEAMWARGDHAEGIKWVRRAAEAASEAEKDTRALELAKAAADLAGLVARHTRGSIDLEEVELIPEPVPTSEGSMAPPPLPRSRPPTPTSAVPSNVPPPPSAGSGGAKGPSASVRPSVPFPPRTSSPPRAKPASLRPGGGAPRSVDKAKGKGRRSRENLDAEAKKAFEQKAPPVAAETAPRVPDTDETAAAPAALMSPKSPTNATSITNILKPEHTAAAADVPDWDAAATQNLTGDDLPFLGDGDRRTAVGAPPAFTAKSQSVGRPSPAAGRPPGDGLTPGNAPGSTPGNAHKRVHGNASASAAQNAHAQGLPSPGPLTPMDPRSPAGARPSAVDQHDPGIQTSQAVRVVVWRDAGGVHVAPAGTMVSAITVDAVLVALEPNADLTAWLSAKTR